MRGILIALLLAVFALPAQAQETAQYLRIELAESRVDITTGFNGTRIAVFGTTTVEGGDLVVALKGPDKTVLVRRKDRVLGAWMNRETVEFRRVPSYYDIATTLTDAEIAQGGPLLRDNGIGVENLGFYPENEEDAQTVGYFRDALIRRMQEKGFYPIRPHVPSFIDTRFFKTTFDLPPGVPTGYYQVEALLIENGAVLAKETRALQVGQVGFNAQVYLFAEEQSFFYGLFAVAIALASGWSAFTFLRRD